jgi:uncharacterized protein (DUF433 family)
MDMRHHIHSDPEILCGKQVVRGTRLSVEFLRSLVDAGWTDEQILDSYPHLTRAGFEAALAASVASD